MKKVIFVIILLIILIGIITIIFFNYRDNENNLENTNSLNQEASENTAINNSNNDLVENTINDNITNTTVVNEVQNSQSEGDEENMENARIKLTVNGQEVFVTLENNQAARDLLEMLPLTLTFEDFNSTEKIATLPDELSTSGLPSGYTPSAGDFAYYAPWGNISVFYEDFRYSSSLYKLGTVESGAEIFGNMNEDFEVTIERVD